MLHSSLGLVKAKVLARYTSRNQLISLKPVLHGLERAHLAWDHDLHYGHVV